MFSLRSRLISQSLLGRETAVSCLSGALGQNRKAAVLGGGALVGRVGRSGS